MDGVQSFSTIIGVPPARASHDEEENPFGPGDVATYAFIFFIIGLFVFANGFILLRRKRLVENTPTAKARSAPMGRVEVSGAIVPFQEITIAPFSGQQCVYFRYSLEERYEIKDKHGDRRYSWKTIDSGKWSVPFFVQDETGKILVDPKGAEVETAADRIKEIIAEAALPEIISKRISLPRRDILRFTERYIKPGEQLFVLGFAGDNPHRAETTRLPYREPCRMRPGAW